MNNVIDFFKADNERLFDERRRFTVHSVKFREKDSEHLRSKIRRKSAPDNPITAENLFLRITDFCGVRVLHLKLSDSRVLHRAIMGHVENNYWALAEAPKAYTWDPEYKAYFEEMGLQTNIKESFYTSLHYLVKPNSDTSVTCEIQIRSLFEEIWGEVDHDLNYPIATESVPCREQLKVLAKLVGAGTKLVESIYGSLPAQVES
jgi:ppGpp synthetase/RelA/SpoT-type nucleotidyltranferase